MEISRAIESLEAAELCLNESLVNSATSRAYYATFQAAQASGTRLLTSEAPIDYGSLILLERSPLCLPR
jgi:uncharacterized protein (UPF0332 family)